MNFFQAEMGDSNGDLQWLLLSQTTASYRKNMDYKLCFTCFRQSYHSYGPVMSNLLDFTHLSTSNFLAMQTKWDCFIIAMPTSLQKLGLWIPQTTERGVLKKNLCSRSFKPPSSTPSSELLFSQSFSRHLRIIEDIIAYGLFL